MSTAFTPGLPIGSTAPSAQVTFDHLPDLWDLLPNGGWPGVIYALVAAKNAVSARANGLQPIRGADYFVVNGPAGSAAVMLMGHGAPIPGASPDSGARELLVDGDIGTSTGHKVSEEVELLFGGPAPVAESHKTDLQEKLSALGQPQRPTKPKETSSEKA